MASGVLTSGASGWEDVCNVRHADAAALATIKDVIAAGQATFFAPDGGELL